MDELTQTIRDAMAFSDQVNAEQDASPTPYVSKDCGKPCDGHAIEQRRVHEWIRKTEPQQRSTTTMDAETQTLWDDYVDARIRKLFDELYQPAIAEFVCDYVQGHLAPLKRAATKGISFLDGDLRPTDLAK